MLAFRQPLGVGPRHCGVVLEDRGPFIGIGKYVLERAEIAVEIVPLYEREVSIRHNATNVAGSGIPRCPIRHTVRAGGGLRVPETLARGGVVAL